MNTLFFDDFAAPELDRSRWNVEVTGHVVNNEQQAYVDSPETVYLQPGDEAGANGALVLHPRHRPGYATADGQRFDFISGRLNTRGKVEFTRGVVSARIKLSAGVGLWPAFWLLGSTGDWPGCGEIDIMENVGEPDWANAAVHGPGYFGETPFVNRKYFAGADGVAGWHVYSAEISPASELLFRVDDALIYRVTRPMIEHYGAWVFDGPKFLILNFALGGIYPFKTNGVRQPYFGLPQATAQMIQRNQPRMMVDWVKVAPTDTPS
ncbi:MAG TPA: glycoside hydrolase family 16 protein [Thermoflexales bacterium]|nr:glycoside hydrolase family 16 protein [Thermoflexales bacterium]HQZ20963.1 glycoside hydrolase family 16 protein [Thermoflexales bacterium]HQZ98658.1 glycoside hydrolase family 16 protein [Thermoflexales bacterium]